MSDEAAKFNVCAQRCNEFSAERPPTVLRVSRAVSGLHLLLNFVPTDGEMEALYDLVRERWPGRVEG